MKLRKDSSQMYLDFTHSLGTILHHNNGQWQPHSNKSTAVTDHRSVMQMQIKFNNEITNLKTSEHEEPNRIDPQGTELRNPPTYSRRMTIPDNEHRRHWGWYTHRVIDLQTHLRTIRELKTTKNFKMTQGTGNTSTPGAGPAANTGNM